MAPERQSADAFLAAIEAKIAAWKAVADSYRAAVSLDGPLSEGTATDIRQHKHAVMPPAKATDLPVGVFRDKSIREAIEILLTAGRRKQTNKEIAVGLQKGGIATTSRFFEATVATALGRMKDDGIVLRFPDGWDLAASYPDSLRSRLEKDAKPQKRSKRRNSASSEGSLKTTREDSDKTALILKAIQQHGSRMSLSQIQSSLEAVDVQTSRDYIRLVVRRLVKRGLVQRDGLLGYLPAPRAQE